MKKRIITVLLALSMVMSVGACGGKGSDTSDSDTVGAKSDSDTESAVSGAGITDYDPSDYVKLGDYLGVEVELTGDYALDDEAYKKYIDKRLAEVTDYEKDSEATVVEADSIVNLDYQGIKDGTPFDGGSAEDQTIDVAGNCAVGGSGYIDGFTDGLVGMKVGETKECDVTFPANYGSAELAGQQVIFRFTINYICKPAMTYDELTDEYVQENLGAKSVESYLENEREIFETSQNEEKESELKSAVREQVIANAEISGYPEDVVTSRVDTYFATYSEDGDFETYLQETYGMTAAQFRQEMTTEIKEGMDGEMVFYAIAEAEGIEADEDGFKAYVQELMDRYGDSDEKTLYESFGRDAAEGEEYLKYTYRCNKALDLCVEKAVIK